MQNTHSNTILTLLSLPNVVGLSQMGVGNTPRKEPWVLDDVVCLTLNPTPEYLQERTMITPHKQPRWKRPNSNNSIIVLQPYVDRDAGWWAFDDERTGLVAEPFVAGISEMIDVLVENIPDAKDGFNLIFSKTPFPKSRQLKLMAEEDSGAWYRDVETRLGGWLCPALFLYFDIAPEQVYVAAYPIHGRVADALKALEQS